MWTTVGGTKLEVSGLAGIGSLSLGGYLNPKLVLFGESVVNVVSSPTIKVAGVEAPTDRDITATTSGVGAGLGYYLSDTWYLEGTVFLSWMTLEENGNKIAETDPGFGLNVLLGKEWPVSNKVALGVSAQGNFAVMKDKGENASTWNSLGGGLTFSFIWVPKGSLRSEDK